MTISVVIPTYRRAESLRRCLRALARQSFIPDEVIVVSDASPDHTRDVVEEADVPVKFVELTENRGPAAARNAGIRAARGNWIAFTDDDCEPDEEWLSRLSWIVHTPRAAGFGGRVVAAEDHLIARYSVRHRVLEPPPHVTYLVTCNCIYRKDLLVKVGGFDERIRRPGGEDPDLSGRIRELGYTLGYEPLAVVRHHFRRGLREFVRTFFTYGRGGQPAAVAGTEPFRLREFPHELARSLRSYDDARLPPVEKAGLLALRAAHLSSYLAGWFASEIAA